MAAPDTTVVQVNVKTPAGSLLNIYAENVAEAKEIAEAVIEDLVNTVAALEQAVGAAGTVAAAVPVAPRQPAASASPPAPAPAATGGPACDCGLPMKLIPAGVNKAGKPFRAFYACSQPREQQCGKRINA